MKNIATGAAFAALITCATGVSAATTGNWSFGLNGETSFGSVSFSGTDTNNDGILRTSDGEVTSLLGNYDLGNSGSPGYLGITFDLTYASLTYVIDGIFGDNNIDYVGFSNSFTNTCHFWICGWDPYETYVTADFSFSGDVARYTRTEDGRLTRSLAENLGPQLVTGPISDIAPVPLPASAPLLLAGVMGLVALRRRRR